NIPTGANAVMPSAIASSGPNITAASAGAVDASGSGSCLVPITFSIGDWAVNSPPGWFAGFVFYYRVHGTTLPHQDGIKGVTGAVSGITATLHIPAALTVDIGIAYEGAQSVQSAIAWSAYLASITTPAILPPGTIAGTNEANLVPDGQLAHVLSGSNEAYWYEYLIDGVSFLALANGDSTSYGLFAWHSGANGSGRYANSQPFNLVGGTTYTMSSYIDLINATGTGGVRVIGPVSGTVNNTNPPNAASSIASILKAGGSSGHFSYTFTPSTSGKYVFQASNSGISVGGSPIYMGQFQVEQGSSFTGFKPNTPAQTQGADTGTTAHTAASQPVQQTLTQNSGAEGSFLASATVARRHVAGNTTFNFLFNPTAAINTQGWATADYTGHGGFSRDSQWGGRFIITVANASLSGVNVDWYQTVTVVPSTTYTVSGNYYCNSLPSGGSVYVDVWDGTTVLAASVALTSATGVLTPFSFSFTTTTQTTIELRLLIYTGSTSPGVACSAAFSAMKLEYGTVSTPHSDDTTTSLVTTTHQPTADPTDGSYLQPSVITRRVVAGNTGSNLVYNPTGRLGTKGWFTYNGPGTAAFTYDSFLGGRLSVSIPAGSYGSTAYAWYYQTIPVFSSTPYTLSGKAELDGGPASGGSSIIDCYDNLGTYYYSMAVTTPGSGQVPSSVSFTTASGATTITIRLRVTVPTST
ncbi:MAG: hypothetical protein IAI49_16095, partial [Candidatus Eremiobacteraeota bacterium]|nr:hypothetical protein [Candidatus Eremiobacteraeota bacterium]